MNTFIQSFANSNQWEQLKEILETYKDVITDVNDESIIVDGANKGELFVGKQFAGKAFELFIGDIDKYKNKETIKKSDKDNFN